MDKKKLEKIENASKKAQEQAQKLDILDVLLDEENREPIVLMDANGKKLAFEQIAVIPHNDKIYCVLKPIDHIDNVQDDEAIVFFVHEQAGKEPVLMVETDEKVAMEVFDEYYTLLDEEEAKRSAKKKTGTASGSKPAAGTATKTTATKSAQKTTSSAAANTTAKTATKAAPKTTAISASAAKKPATAAKKPVSSTAHGSTGTKK